MGGLEVDEVDGEGGSVGVDGGPLNIDGRTLCDGRVGGRGEDGVGRSTCDERSDGREELHYTSVLESVIAGLTVEITGIIWMERGRTEVAGDGQDIGSTMRLNIVLIPLLVAGGRKSLISRRIPQSPYETGSSEFVRAFAPQGFARSGEQLTAPEGFVPRAFRASRLLSDLSIDLEDKNHAVPELRTVVLFVEN